MVNGESADPQQVALVLIAKVVDDKRGSPEARLMAVTHMATQALGRECPEPCPICIANSVTGSG